MKNVFLLMIALASSINAADRPMICTQRGFQVGAQLGWGLTQPSNTVYEFEGPLNTASSINTEIDNIIQINDNSQDGQCYIYGLGLDYSNLSSWKSTSAMIAGLNLGYKWLFNSSQYSVTANVFVQYNGSAMCSNLKAVESNFEGYARVSNQTNSGSYLLCGVGSSYQPAGDLRLDSGPVFGFNCLIAKELSWGNTGLLLGIKFNPYRLKYLETNPKIVEKGVVNSPGFMQSDDTANGDVSLNIGDYVYCSSKTQLATGFTIGFATNYYISDHVSAGLTVFYDIYAPVTFNLENIDIGPYVYAGAEQMTDSGAMKFQNNTIGVVMNVTYSFGAN